LIYIVCRAHPTIWRAIDSLRKDQALVATALLRDRHGDPPVKHRGLSPEGIISGYPVW
jgi:hypothetical protein